jgi:Cu-processing system permease protein
MNAATRILRYELQNVRRTRAVLVYGLLLMAVTHALLHFGGGGSRAIVSLLNVVLVFVPMVSLVFGTVYLYSARDFIELLLAQPVSRQSLFAGIWGGLTLPLVLAFVLGTGLPFMWNGGLGDGTAAPLLLLLLSGSLLTAAFTAVAMWIATRHDDRARGLGVALAVWVVVAIAWDGLILLVVASLGDWPLELPLLALSLANPVDAARVGLVLALDAPTLMGYTGAVTQRVLGLSGGAALTLAALGLWVIVPLSCARRRFRRKDF